MAGKKGKGKASKDGQDNSEDSSVENPDLDQGQELDGSDQTESSQDALQETLSKFRDSLHRELFDKFEESQQNFKREIFSELKELLNGRRETPASEPASASATPEPSTAEAAAAAARQRIEEGRADRLAKGGFAPEHYAQGRQTETPVSTRSYQGHDPKVDLRSSATPQAAPVIFSPANAMSDEQLQIEGTKVWRRLEYLGPLPSPGNFENNKKSPKEFRAKPNDFDGTDPTAIEDFFEDLKHLFIAHPFGFSLDTLEGHIYRISATRHYLTGSVRTWYRQQCSRDLVPKSFCNWFLFKKALEKEYGNPLVKEEAQFEMEHLTQSGAYKNVHDYTGKFQDLYRRSGINEESALYQYKRGLSSKIKDALALQGRFSSLPDLQTAAHQQYLRFQERAKEETKSGRSNRHSDSKGRRFDSSHSKSISNTFSSAKFGNKDANRGDRQTSGSSSSGQQNKAKPQAKSVSFKNDKPGVSCYNCGGDHYARDCTSPQKSNLNVLDTTDEETGQSESDYQSPEETESDEESESENE